MNDQGSRIKDQGSRIKDQVVVRKRFRLEEKAPSAPTLGQNQMAAKYQEECQRKVAWNEKHKPVLFLGTLCIEREAS